MQTHIDTTGNESLFRVAHHIENNFNELYAMAASNPLAATSYGILADGVVLADVTTTSGSNVISSTSHKFGRTDIGKLITLPGAGAAAAVVNAKISSVSNGAATLSVSAATIGTSQVGNGAATFGTDDTAAYTKLVTAASTVLNVLGATIVMPLGISVVSSIPWLTNVALVGQGMGKSILKHIMVTDAAVAMISNTAGAGMFNCHFRDFEIDMVAATDATYQVLASGIRISATIRCNCERLYVHDTPATGLAFDFGVECRMMDNVVINAGRLNGTTNLGGAGIGHGINSSNIQSYIVTGNWCINCSTYGIFFEEQTASATIDSNIICNDNVILMNSGSLSGIGDCGSRRFECVGNHITTSSGNTGPAIAIKTGTTGFDPGNQGLIADNVITSVGNVGILLDYTVNIPAGQKCGYVIRGNRIQACSTIGVQVIANASAVLDTLIIDDNWISQCGNSGIDISGAGGTTDLQIRGNTIANNGTAAAGAISQAGIAIRCACTRPRIMDNVIYDNSTGTQLYALAVNTSIALTGALIQNNDFQHNNTGAIDLIGGATIAGVIRNNNGYNPVGAAAMSLGASPNTYTAGNSDETLYMSDSSGITALTVGGVSILPHATAANAVITVEAPANVVVVITSGGTLTGNKYIH